MKSGVDFKTFSVITLDMNRQDLDVQCEKIEITEDIIEDGELKVIVDSFKSKVILYIFFDVNLAFCKNQPFFSQSVRSSFVSYISQELLLFNIGYIFLTGREKFHYDSNSYWDIILITWIDTSFTFLTRVNLLGYPLKTIETVHNV